MTSIRDVAKRLGVSITTVSRALNNYHDVSSATKERILEACKEMNYTPNLYARNLAAKKSNYVALILSDMKKTDANGNIIFRLLLGVQETCNSKGYEPVIVFTNEEKQHRKPLHELCRERNFCAVIIYGLKLTDPYYRQADELHVPCVTIDVETEAKKTGIIGTDNKMAIAEAVELLCERGRRHIAMVNGARDAQISFVREKWFRAAMQNKGRDVPEGMVRYGDYFEAHAYEETKLLMQLYPQVDAIFFASDIMAIGGMRALREMKIAVPQSVSVIGFDGIQMGEYTDPPLTTVRQNFEMMGGLAAEKAILMSAGMAYERRSFAPYRLIERASV